jgi:hypothetical protein
MYLDAPTSVSLYKSLVRISFHLLLQISFNTGTALTVLALDDGITPMRFCIVTGTNPRGLDYVRTEILTLVAVFFNV